MSLRMRLVDVFSNLTLEAKPVLLIVRFPGCEDVLPVLLRADIVIANYSVVKSL